MPRVFSADTAVLGRSARKIRAACTGGLSDQEVFVPDVADNSWMTHPSALLPVAASIVVALLAYVFLQLLWLVWPCSVAAKIRRIQRQWHPRSPDDCPHCLAWTPPQPADLV